MICREEEFKDYAEDFVLDFVGDNVCGIPVAKRVFLSPLGWMCIFAQFAGVQEKCD